jgi:hypothetical protein
MPDYSASDVQQIYCPVEKKNVLMEVSYEPDENRLSMTKCLANNCSSCDQCSNIFLKPKMSSALKASK